MVTSMRLAEHKNEGDNEELIALQLRPDATVRWRGVAGLYGLVVDWNFWPRTQA